MKLTKRYSKLFPSLFPSFLVYSLHKSIFPHHKRWLDAMYHTSFVNNYNEAQKKKGKERVKKNIMIDPQHHTFSVKLQHANVEKKNWRIHTKRDTH